MTKQVTDQLKLIKAALKKVCKKYFDDDYFRLSQVVLSRLAEVDHLKLSGKPEGWAGGVMLGLMEHNFLHQMEFSLPSNADLCAVLEISTSTLRNRTRDVMSALDMEKTEGSMDYMHPTTIQIIERMLVQDPMMADDQHYQTRMRLILPENISDAEGVALIDRLNNAMSTKMNSGSFDMDDFVDLAASMGIEVELDELSEGLEHEPAAVRYS